MRDKDKHQPRGQFPKGEPPPDYLKNWPIKSEPDSETECDNCGATVKYDSEFRDEPELCEDCHFSRAMANLEAPEGGWPRGSDMDRI